MDTLAFGYILPTTGRIPDLHRLETCAAGRTQKELLGERNIFSDSPGALLIFRFTPYLSSGSKSTPRNTSI